MGLILAYQGWRLVSEPNKVETVNRLGRTIAVAAAVATLCVSSSAKPWSNR